MAEFWKARDMNQHHKLICGGLSVFFAATHVGCAGSGLKNMFTRNETDGYHSLDELAVEERAVAEAEESEVEDGAPSMVTRLASWRPFSKAESEEADDYAADETPASKGDLEEAGTSPRFLGRAFSKRDAVEPDPFLGTEPKRPDRAESPVFKALADQEVAKSDHKPVEADDEFSTEPDPKSEGNKDGDADAVALGASRVSRSAGSNSEDEDNALAKRFEEHFLLNSVGTVAKTEVNATAAGTDLQQKAATAAKMAESKKRDRSSIADRQVAEFESLLAADPDCNGKKSGFRRNSEATPLKTSKRNYLTSEKSGNSLYAFDQLIGADGSAASRETSGVTHKATRSPGKNAGAMNIDVADAEALFGAAAARQNARTQQAEGAPRSQSSGHNLARSGTSSPTLDNTDRFEWNESTYAQPGSESDRTGDDVSSAFERHVRGDSGAGKKRDNNVAFGMPTASAGDVEDRSIVGAADIRLSNASASATRHKIVTANYGTAHPFSVTHPVSTETPAAGDAHFTAAPVAPVSQPESGSEVVSAATRPGLVQSFSTRNWLLLIGGIIVIALLFAPGRTKPLTMNGRPANG